MDTRHIDAAITAASRAPSAHNIQPWQVRRNGGQVVATVDPSRTMPLADPAHQDTLLAMGCWVECLSIALGSAVAVAVSGRAPDVTVQVTPVTGSCPTFTVEEMTRRQVDRGRLRHDAAALSRARNEFSRLGATSELFRLDEPTWRWAHHRSTVDTARTEGVLREALDWMRLDPAHPAYGRDGLNAECLRIPRALGMWAARALETEGVSRRAIRTAPFWQPVASRLYHARNRTPPARLVLAAPGHRHPGDVIELGRELLRCWLVLGRQGLRVAVNSQIKDNPVTAARLPPGTFAVFSTGRSTGPVPRSARLGEKRPPAAT